MEAQLLVVSLAILDVQRCHRWKRWFVDIVGTLATKCLGEHVVIVDMPLKCVWTWWLFELITWECHGTIKIVPGVLWPHRIGWIGERLFLGIYKGILHIRTPRKLDSDWACHWEQFIIPVGKITHEIGCFFRRNECYPSVLNFYHSCWSPLA